ncbi:hypothetical protein SANTM175S_00558 [Streptomyces antimycoticus]
MPPLAAPRPPTTRTARWSSPPARSRTPEILNYVKDHLADKAGLKLEVREFTDYNTPNLSTQDGSVGANYFQNQPFLDDFNKKKGTDIVPVVTVHLEPLGLYSHKVKKAGELKRARPWPFRATRSTRRAR